MDPPTFTVTRDGRRVVSRSRVRPAVSVARIRPFEKSVPSVASTRTSTPSYGSPLRLRARTRICAWPPAGGSCRGSAHTRTSTFSAASVTGGSGAGSGVGGASGASGARGGESRKRPHPGSATSRSRRSGDRKRAMDLWYAVVRGSALVGAIVAGGGGRLSHGDVVRVPAVRAGHGRRHVRLAGHGLEGDVEAPAALRAVVRGAARPRGTAGGRRGCGSGGGLRGRLR